jgi:hypothetical protein
MVWYIGFRPTIPDPISGQHKGYLRKHKSYQTLPKTFRQGLRAQRAPSSGKCWRNIEKLLASQNEPETKAGDKRDDFLKEPLAKLRWAAPRSAGALVAFFQPRSARAEADLVSEATKAAKRTKAFGVKANDDSADV